MCLILTTFTAQWVLLAFFSLFSTTAYMQYANNFISFSSSSSSPSACMSAHPLVSQGYDASVAQRLWTVTSNQLWWSPCFCTDMPLWQGSASDCLFWNRPETCGSICSVGRRRAGSPIALWSNIYSLGEYIVTLPVGVLNSTQQWRPPHFRLSLAHTYTNKTECNTHAEERQNKLMV